VTHEGGRTLAVLVVDDDAVDRMAVHRALVGVAKVSEAGDGVEALELVRDARFDCVLLDYQLPRLDGLEVLRQLRARGDATPVVMLTGTNDAATAVSLMKAGASEFVSKDALDPARLAAAVRAAVRIGELERERSETARMLEEQRSRVVVALEAAELGSFSLDARTLSGEWDPRACEILGCSGWRGEFLDHVAPEDRIALRDTLRAAAQARLPTATFEFRSASSGRWCRASASILGEVGGARLIGTVQDVSELRRATDEARRREELQRLLLGVVSHDLRNPLSAIVTGVELLDRGGGLSERQSRTVGRLRSSAARMQRLVDDLLDFTRVRGGQQIPITPRPCTMDDVVRPVLDELEAANPKRTFARDGDADLAGSWDPDRLAQVASNLVTNAVKYGAPASPIEVSWRGEGEEAVLRVKNAGNPIPPEQFPTIFEPLVQLSDRTRGIGLGLFISREIVRAHGGTLEVASDAERGTVFEVRLPRV
jgi:signal transduction histidine kinase